MNWATQAKVSTSQSGVRRGAFRSGITSRVESTQCVSPEHGEFFPGSVSRLFPTSPPELKWSSRKWPRNSANS